MTRPKDSYDAVIIGGGGHGLATAYYLAKEHGITNVAVLEKGWLGGGNTGRNTTIIRSNYLWDESAAPLRAVAQALGRPDARTQLQHHVQPARRAEPRAITCTTCATAMRRVAREPAQRHRRRMADAGRRSRNSARSSTSRRRALSGPRRAAAAPRRHRPPRRGRLGLCARRRRAAASTSSRTAKSPASAARAARSPASRRRAARSTPKGRRRRRRAFQRARGRWPASALPIESHPLQALVSEPIKPVHRLRRDVERRARLRQPVGQGRARHRRRHRRLHSYAPARLLPRHRAPDGGAARAVSDLQPAAHDAPVGRHRRLSPGRAARSSGRRRSTASTSIAAGAPAASRPRPARAGCSPTRSRRTSRTR